MIELSVDQSKLVALGKLMKKEANAAQLKKDLIADFKIAAEPGMSQVKGKLQAIPHEGPPTSPAMGSYLASRVRLQVRLTGRSAGVRIRIQQTPSLRGFAFAARRLNRKSWRHTVYGDKERWVTQTSPIPGYFDETLSSYKEAYTAAVLLACRKLARRLGERL
jgi:hypothetical protein